MLSVGTSTVQAYRLAGWQATTLLERYSGWPETGWQLPNMAGQWNDHSAFGRSNKPARCVGSIRCVHHRVRLMERAGLLGIVYAVYAPLIRAMIR